MLEQVEHRVENHSFSLNKLTGYSLIGTGVFATLGFILHPHAATSENQTMWITGHLLILFSLFLNNLGLTSLFFTNANRLGATGLLGFLITSLSLMLYIGKLYWSGFIYPVVVLAEPQFIETVGLGPGKDPIHSTIKAVYFTGAIAFAIGNAVFGSALLKARLFNPVPVTLMITGAVLVGIWPLLPGLVQMLSIVFSAIYAIGVVWLGVIHLRMK